MDLPREDDDAVAPVLDEAWVGTDGDWLDQRVGAALPVLSSSPGMKLTADQARRVAVAAQGFARGQTRRRRSPVRISSG